MKLIQELPWEKATLPIFDLHLKGKLHCHHLRVNLRESITTSAKIMTLPEGFSLGQMLSQLLELYKFTFSVPQF